jgi:hypothetical protein
MLHQIKLKLGGRGREKGEEVKKHTNYSAFC